MKAEIEALKKQGENVLACCCGHGRYPKTIVVKTCGYCIEYFSGVMLPRLKRFYRRDALGFYYIPEISQPQTSPLPLDHSVGGCELTHH
jgi:hypothetical protein